MISGIEALYMFPVVEKTEEELTAREKRVINMELEDMSFYAYQRQIDALMKVSKDRWRKMYDDGFTPEEATREVIAEWAK